MGVRITGEEGVPRVFSNLAVILIPPLFNRPPTLPLHWQTQSLKRNLCKVTGHIHVHKMNHTEKKNMTNIMRLL